MNKMKKKQQNFARKTTDEFDDVTEQQCILCNVPYMCKSNFFDHLIGKRHIKNSKNKRNTLESSDKTLYIKEIPKGSFIDVLNCFWPYGIIDASVKDNAAFIEFATLGGAQRAAKDAHIVHGYELNINFKTSSKIVTPTKRLKNNGNICAQKKKDLIYISPMLAEAMDKIVSEKEVDLTVLQLIRETELKEEECSARQNVGISIEKFLCRIFPATRTYIFGSSANFLGFTGCDIDMYADLGVYPYASGSKQQMEQNAADLTLQIAKEIRRRRRGYNVIPISRARVPIVKFKDCFTGLDIDLSFRSPMPIQNTALINLYTRTHNIVRPYLMLLRYWGKLQDIVGGAQPTTLITNYCYAMLMLFWIMYRNPPIVPPLSELREKLYFPNQRLYRPVIIDGWDCSFSDDIHEWFNKHHETSVIGLAQEFFEFYGELDTAKWVICPLVGQLITKRDLSNQNPRYLPAILHPYCDVAKFHSNTPFSVQDPFEHNHNIARGLNEYPLMVFQYKCKKAAEICKLIRLKKASLRMLFEPIFVVDSVVKQNNNNKVEARETDTKISSVDNEDNDGIAVLFESINDCKQLEECICSSSDEKSPNSIDGIDSTLKSVSDSDTNNVTDQGEQLVLAQTPVCFNSTKNGTTGESFSDVEIIGESSRLSKNIAEVTLDGTNSCTAIDSSFSGTGDKEIVSLENELDLDYSDLIIIDEDNGDTDDELIIDGSSVTEKSHSSPVQVLEAYKNNETENIYCNTSGPLYNAPSCDITFPMDEPLKLNFCFTARQEFSVSEDGNINVKKAKLMTGHSRDNKVKEIIIFILKSCLLCTTEDSLNDEIETDKISHKRKYTAMADSESLAKESAKRFKNDSKNVSKVYSEFTHLLNIKCTSSSCTWKNRRILSKKLIRDKNSLLHYEKALSELLMRVSDVGLGMYNITCHIDIWKKTTETGQFCVTCKEIDICTKKTNYIKDFFQLFSKIVKDAFADTSNYLKLMS